MRARRLPARPPRRCRGFSLLEVLAAFVILALVATSLFGLFSGALGNASAADDWSRAVLVAESRLAAAAETRPLVEGSTAGTEEDGRLRWESRVSRWEPPDAAPGLAGAADTSPTRLYRIEVDVHFPGVASGERVVQLATVRLAAREAQ